MGNAVPGHSDTPEGLKIRDTIIQADNAFLKEATKINTNSRIVSDRLKKYNGMDSEVLYPPLIDPDIYYCGSFNKYIFIPAG